MIGSCGSSGSSLVSYLINLHPSVVCPPELFLLNKKKLYSIPFTQLKEGIKIALENRYQVKQRKIRRKTLNNRFLTISELDTFALGSSTYAHIKHGEPFLDPPNRLGWTLESWLKILNFSNSFEEFVESIFQIIILESGKKRWAEKTPSNCYCIREFLELFPTGNYIHVIRDVRDVVPSLMRRGASPEIAARRWLHDNALWLSHRNNLRCHQVKYEELVRKPHDILDKLFAYLNEDTVSKEILESHKANHEMNYHKTWNLRTNQGISTLSTGKWKKKNFPEKRYLEQLFRNTYISHEFAKIIGLKDSININEMIFELGYDLLDEWDVNKRFNLKFFGHFLTEKALKLISRENIYCDLYYQ